MTSVTIRYVFKLRFVLLGLMIVFIGYYELISCSTDGSNSFFGAYVLFIVWLIWLLIGSLVRITWKGSLFINPLWAPGGGLLYKTCLLWYVSWVIIHAWFCSFSAAETRWSHLLKTLGRLEEKKDYTDCESENMKWQQKKSDLIQKDPVTCARNFEHMVQLFIKDVLKSDEMPIGEIADFFTEWISTRMFFFFLKEFNYLQNPLKRNVSATCSIFFD